MVVRISCDTECFLGTLHSGCSSSAVQSPLGAAGGWKLGRDQHWDSGTCSWNNVFGIPREQTNSIARMCRKLVVLWVKQAERICKMQSIQKKVLKGDVQNLMTWSCYCIALDLWQLGAEKANVATFLAMGNIRECFSVPESQSQRKWRKEKNQLAVKNRHGGPQV